MRKTTLIRRLQRIEGNPQIYVASSESGGAFGKVEKTVLNRGLVLKSSPIYLVSNLESERGWMVPVGKARKARKKS